MTARLAVRAALVAALLGPAGALLAQPANDTCSTAAVLNLNTPTQGTTVGASSTLWISCAQDAGDVWYTFTVTQTAPYTFEATGPNAHELTLAVLSGCEFPIGEFACTTGSGGMGPRIDIQLFAGSPIRIRVGSLNPSGTPFTLTAGSTPPPVNDTCAGALPLTLFQPIASNNLSATTSLELTDAGLCGTVAPGFAGGADVFFAFTPPSDGYYDFSTCGSDIDTIVSVHSSCPASAGNVIACNDNAPLRRCPSPFDSYSSYLPGVELFGGVTYYIRVAGVLIYNPFTGEIEGPGRGSFNLSVVPGSPAPVPANDLCEDAEPIPANWAVNGTTAQTTVSSLTTCGYDDVFDVWYSFTSTAAERRSFWFELLPGAFNSAATLAAYSACGGELLACHTSNPLTNPEMELAVALEPGETILLRVAGNSAVQGDFTMLTITGPVAPANVTCDAAQPLTPGQPVTVDTFGANSDLGSGCGLGTDVYPLWYSFTAPQAGYFRFATDFPIVPEAFDRTSLTFYTGCEAAAPILCTSRGDSFSENPMAAAAAVYLEQGQTLRIRAAYESPPRRGTFSLVATGPLPPPPAVPNDTCASPTVISSVPFQASVDVTLATRDQDVCTLQGTPPAASTAGIWYTYTPDVDRVLRGNIVTADGFRRGRVSVFTGSCGSLTQVGCPPRGSLRDPGVPLATGVTYHLLVSLESDRGAAGDDEELPYGTIVNIDLIALPVPANNTCATAERIAETPAEFSINTLAAGPSTPAPSCAGSMGTFHNTMWYTIRPRTAGTLTVVGIGAIEPTGYYNAAGALYTGPCGSLTEVACDNPTEGWFLSDRFTITAPLAAGETYRLAIGSWTGAGGGVVDVSIDYTGDLACPADFDGDGAVTTADITAFLSAWFADRAAVPPTLHADFDGNGVVNTADITAYLSAWFAARADPNC